MGDAHVSRIHAKEGGLYGLTTVDVIHLAYKIAEKQNINHCFSKGTQMAEVDWLKGFLNRHSSLIITVLATKLSCAISFNRVKVIHFKRSLRCTNTILKRTLLKIF